MRGRGRTEAKKGETSPDVRELTPRRLTGYREATIDLMSENQIVWVVGNEAVILSRHETREAAVAAYEKLDRDDVSVIETNQSWLDFVASR
jgi:hypothetical protein